MFEIRFRTPIDADARELRQWFDRSVSSNWTASVTFMSRYHTLAKSEKLWQRRESFWDLVVSISRGVPAVPLFVRFEDHRDARLFVLIWGQAFNSGPASSREPCPDR